LGLLGAPSDFVGDFRFAVEVVVVVVVVVVSLRILRRRVVVVVEETRGWKSSSEEEEESGSAFNRLGGECFRGEEPRKTRGDLLGLWSRIGASSSEDEVSDAMDGERAI